MLTCQGRLDLTRHEHDGAPVVRVPERAVEGRATAAALTAEAAAFGVRPHAVTPVSGAANRMEIADVTGCRCRPPSPIRARERAGKMCSVDEHARRVVQGVLEAAAAVRDGRASISDLQASAAGAAGALDNSYADLRAALERLDSDLEMIRFTVDDASQAAAIRQTVERVRDAADLS
jgi:hypothetical protein